MCGGTEVDKEQHEPVPRSEVGLVKPFVTYLPPSLADDAAAVLLPSLGLAECVGSVDRAAALLALPLGGIQAGAQKPCAGPQQCNSSAPVHLITAASLH